MRIKVGMKVEALITEEATNNMGAWRAGEVIWGNGHSYVMRWADGGPDSARISRKFVRPSPDPDVDLPDDLDAGDIVELFDCDLWKWAEVVRVGDQQIDVKIVGSTRVVTADRSALRPRLIYGEKGWTLIHKNDKIPIESAVPSRPIAGKNLKTKAIGSGGGGSNFAAHAVKLGKTKRSNYAMDADIVRDVKRFQGNGDSNNRIFANREEPAARYDDNLEVMDVHPSHYLEKRQETGNNKDCFLARRTDKDNDDDDDVSSKSDTSSSSSDSSSGGSSSSDSSSSNAGYSAVSATAEHCQENKKAEVQLLPSCNEEEQDSHIRTEPQAHAHASAARMQHHPAANEQVKVAMKQDEQHDRRVSVHGLELEAYESVMKAFHATGSLSWTKEELLSNLRLHLHVSSDEHLHIIRRLNGNNKKPAGGPRNGHC